MIDTDGNNGVGMLLSVSWFLELHVEIVDDFRAKRAVHQVCEYVA